jgi:cell division protein FtsN
MVDHPADSGYELVLDNRKLIITFVVLVLTWCCFFVLGFMEGKRQGYQAGAQTAAETSPKSAQEEAQAPTETQSAGLDSEAKAKKEDSEEKPLNWYKDVSEKGAKPEIASKPDASKSVPKATEVKSTVEPAPKEAPAKVVVEPAPKAMPAKSAAEPAPKTTVAKTAAEPAPKPSATPAASAASSYTVQVGAFRQRQQAEAKAQQLKAKGFDGRIEPPQSAEDLYLLKVGKFKTRTEAVAVQLQLKKSGFASFIKTN